MKEKKGIKLTVLIVFLYTTLNACALLIPLSYIDYVYTDLAHVDYSLMSVGLSVSSIIGLLFSLFTGILIQKTRSRFGQFLPWIVVCGLLMVGGTLMTVSQWGSPMRNFVFVTIGYCLATVASDTQLTAQYGILEKFSLGDSDARNSIMASSMAGSNAGNLIFAAILLTLVEAFGHGDESKGFFGAEVVIGCCVVLGLILITLYGRKFDKDNRTAVAEDIGSVSVKEMLKGVATNKALLTVAIAECFKMAGYSVFTYLMVYQCTYVLGDLNLMTFTLTGMGAICVVASAVAPYFVKLFKGRKRAFIATSLIGAAAYGAMAFTGGSVVGFMIPFVIASFFEGVYMSVAINCYLDAGEWWYDKSGEDTRAFAMSIQAIGGKIAMAVAGVVLGVALGICGYADEVGIASAEGMRACTLQTGLYPALTCLICALILIFFHKISDDEMESIIARNAEKDAELFGNMEA